MGPWDDAPLGKLCVLGPQYGANAKAVPASGREPRYIRITDITPDGDLLPGPIVEADTSNSEAYELADGDVLFARSGATVGKTYLHQTPTGPAIFAGYLIRFRPNPCLLDPRFLYFFTKSGHYRRWVRSKRRVAAQPNINGVEYASLRIPLPGLSEQRRIVEILYQADHLRRLRAEASAKADRILPALFLKMFGDPEANPMGWDVKEFRNVLAESPRNGLSPSSTGRFPARVLTLSSVTGREFIEGAAKEGLFERPPSDDKRVDHRDFLVCRGNGNLKLVGRGRFSTRSLPNTVFPDTIIASRIDFEQIDRAYLETLWESNFARRQIETQARTTSGIHKINQTALANMEIPIPPVDLQREFGKRAYAFRASDLAASENGLRRISTVLYQRAFSGALTERWRESHTDQLLNEMKCRAKALAEAL